MTTTITSVRPLGDGATVVLQCGHRYSVVAPSLPSVGSPQHCWRCERESAGRAA